MIMHKVLHTRDDKDRFYVPRKEGGRGFPSIENRVAASVQGLKEYKKRDKKKFQRKPIRRNRIASVDYAEKETKQLII